MHRPIIIKLGTESVVNKATQKLRSEILTSVAQNVRSGYRQGKKFLIVSSGAVACGQNNRLANKLGLNSDKQSDKQLLAAIGQPAMYDAWRKAFYRLGILTGEFLFTHRLLTEEETKHAVIASVRQFIKHVGVPICNELDSICPDEIKAILGGGDNDILTKLLSFGLLPSKVIFLTETDYVYHPVTGAPVRTLSSRDEEFELAIIKVIGKKNGIATKVSSAMEIVREIPDCTAIIASYKEPEIVCRLLAGEQLGTIIKSPDRQ